MKKEEERDELEKEELEQVVGGYKKSTVIWDPETGPEAKPDWRAKKLRRAPRLGSM